MVVTFKEHINFSWCLYEDCTRNVDGLAAVKGSGGSKNGFRKRFWFCKICKDYDTEVLQKVKSTGLGLCCLRDFESKKLLEHQNSSKHIECRQGLEQFRKSANNALAVSISKDRKQKFHCIYIAAYVAKHQYPLDAYENMTQFCGDVLELDLPRASGKLKWCSRGVGTGLINAISSCLLSQQVSEIRRSTFWSVGFDESSNVSTEDALLVYLRYLNKGVPTTEMHKILNVECSKTGIFIARHILECLSNLGLDFNKCISFG